MSVLTYADKPDISDTVVDILIHTLQNSSDLESVVIKTKVLRTTRAMDLVAADVAYAGIGFTPTMIIAFCNSDAHSDEARSFGVSSSDKTNYCIAASTVANHTMEEAVAYLTQSDGWVKATLSTYDADGFTLTWTRYGTGPATPAGTANLVFLCFLMG